VAFAALCHRGIWQTHEVIGATESPVPARRLTTMRLALLVVIGFTGTAVADKGTDVTGTFEVKYEEVANNCTAASTGISLARGTVGVSKKAKLVVVDIERFPTMQGSQAKGGQLKAASKVGPSPIQGADVKVSIAGRVEDGLISGVFVADYYVGKKPLCTQSWKVSGVRKEALEPKAAADLAPAPAVEASAMRFVPLAF
jgi:hypothetical protein